MAVAFGKPANRPVADAVAAGRVLWDTTRGGYDAMLSTRHTDAATDPRRPDRRDRP